MLYINDPNIKPVTYSDLVKAVVKAGIQPQRAYIYLASLGIKGENTRQLLNDGISYSKPQKLAVNGDNGEFITSFYICKTCKTIKMS